MSKKRKAPTQVLPKVSQERAPNWDVFFHYQRNPLLRSQLITALLSGHQLEVERLPAATLLDAVLLSMAARNYAESEVIDDYSALLRRVDEAWKSPLWTRRVFDQTHMGTADFILRGTSEFTCHEDAYIPDFVTWLLEHEVPNYFAEELAA